MGMTAERDTKQGMTFAIVSVVLVSVAQLALKFGMAHIALDSLRVINSLRELCTAVAGLSAITTVLPLVLGIFCYGASFFFWLAALGRLPLNLAYPLLSLSYPLVYLGAALLPFFNEALNAQRIGGIALIMLGIALLVRQPASREFK